MQYCTSTRGSTTYDYVFISQYLEAFEVSKFGAAQDAIDILSSIALTFLIFQINYGYLFDK